MTNPAAPERNLHHTNTYYSLQDWYDTNLGVGPAYYYPGEPKDTHNYPLCSPESVPF